MTVSMLVWYWRCWAWLLPPCSCWSWYKLLSDNQWLPTNVPTPSNDLTISVSALTQSQDINVVIPPITISKPPASSVSVSVPTSSWKPSQWATWPFITITGVSGEWTTVQNCAKRQPTMACKKFAWMDGTDVTESIVFLFLTWVSF